MKKELLILGAFSFIIIISVLITISEDKLNALHACSRLEEFKNEEYNGIVLKKYIDEKNHQFRTIELSNKKTIVLVRDTSKLYNFIQQNDSLVKRNGTDVLMVYRLDTIHGFKIYHGCSE